MVDTSTLNAYDSDPRHFADRWDAQPPAEDLYEILRRFFTMGRTAEVGCGSGRDAAWLLRQGYPMMCFEASAGLIHEARLRHPELPIEQKALPGLDDVPERSFVNVLCETVIMHVPRDEIGPSVRRLVSLLAPKGTLYLSWRVTRGNDKRDDRGRLYTAFEPGAVNAELRGTTILLNEEAVSESSGNVVHRVVARRNATPAQFRYEPR